MKLGFPEPASALMQDIDRLHVANFTVALVLMALVLAIMAFIVLRFRRRPAREADALHHRGRFARWSWLLAPLLILAVDLLLAGRSSALLERIEDASGAELTIKVTGSQWYWTYEYLEDGIKVVSNLLPRERAGGDYLRLVDNPLVLPVGKRVRFLHTATDVIHAWWVPQLVVKKDAIPGYINESWTRIERAGTYFGQCSENCGTGHSAMPIQVSAVTAVDYRAWVDEQKAAQAKALGAAGRAWGHAELMAHGEQVYLTYCARCHMPGGEGNPPFRPALKGSPIASGPVAGHLDRVMNGKARTDMRAWKHELNDLDIAAVVTYERNAWGNATGDTVQPLTVGKARAGGTGNDSEAAR